MNWSHNHDSSACPAIGKFCHGCTTYNHSVLCCCSTQQWLWLMHKYTRQVDVQLNSTMRLISGTLRSTPLPWLPVLSNIELPVLRRKAAADKLVENIVKYNNWPIQPDILNPPFIRLPSRKPLWLDLQPADIKSTCQLKPRVRTHNLATGFWPLVTVVTTEPFSHGIGTLVPAEGNGNLNPLLWQRWMVAYPGCTWQMKMLFPGSPITVRSWHAHEKNVQKRLQTNYTSMFYTHH